MIAKLFGVRTLHNNAVFSSGQAQYPGLGE